MNGEKNTHDHSKGYDCTSSCIFTHHDENENFLLVLGGMDVYEFPIWEERLLHYFDPPMNKFFHEKSLWCLIKHTTRSIFGEHISRRDHQKTSTSSLKPTFPKQEKGAGFSVSLKAIIFLFRVFLADPHFVGCGCYVDGVCTCFPSLKT